MVKSQILKGGRGKGTFDSGLEGGIQVVDDPAAAESVASQMLGHRLKTKQTGEPGLRVNKVYVAETIKYDDEWYLAMTIDREKYSPAIIVSKSGGVDIETMAKENPEKLLTFHYSISKGITPELVQRISAALETSAKEKENLEKILTRMHNVFTAKDATLLEINPLVRKSDEDFLCLDAKFSFDDAASPRQKELFSLRDSEDIEEDQSTEMEAKEYDLVYIRLDGNIGNVVNGAGLAMATNDAIAFHGGASANFLDAGGQATQQTMQKAFEIILRDERVKVILVNIYGGESNLENSCWQRSNPQLGIIRCDMIAESIIGAAKELGSFRVPMVVRLQGTNSEEGLKLVRCLTVLLPDRGNLTQLHRSKILVSDCTLRPTLAMLPRELLSLHSLHEQDRSDGSRPVLSYAVIVPFEATFPKEL